MRPCDLRKGIFDKDLPIITLLFAFMQGDVLVVQTLKTAEGSKLQFDQQRLFNISKLVPVVRIYNIIFIDYWPLDSTLSLPSLYHNNTTRYVQ